MLLLPPAGLAENLRLGNVIGSLPLPESLITLIRQW